MALTQAQQNALYAETDIRFWAQTGYKIARRLDPNSPADAAYIPVWSDIYAKVLAEHQAHGWATPTHRSDAVLAPLSRGHAAQAKADAHAQAAIDAPDQASRDAHIAAAQAAHDEAAQHAADAARAQPPSISHEAVHAASTRAAEQTAQASPINADLSAKHQLSESDRAAAKQALADVLNALRTPGTAAQAAAAQFAAAAQAQTAQPPTSVPGRPGALDPSGVAPGQQPGLDAGGRVEQPTGAATASSRWAAIAFGVTVLATIVAAGVATSRGGRSRGRRKSRALPVAYIGGR